MSKKSDDSIERIFRQALTQYDTTFQESDWVKMEKLLEEEANRRAAARSKRIKGTAYTLTGLTGLIIAVYFLAFKNPSGSIAKLNNAVDEMQATGDLKEEGNVKLENPSDGLLSETSPPGSAEAQKDASGKAVNPLSLNVEKGKSSIVAAQGNEGKKIDRASNIHPSKGIDAETYNVQQSQSQELSAVDNNGDSNDGVAVGETPMIMDDTGNNTTVEGDGVKSGAGAIAPAAGSAGVIISENASNGAVSSEHGKLNSISSTSGTNPSTAAQDSVSQTQHITVAAGVDSTESAKGKPESKQKVRPPYRWSVGLVFAPEFSTTSLTEYTSPGSAFGLRIGYQVSNRFNIETGLIRSTKKYDGDGSDYAPRNPLYWQIRTNGVVPGEIDSECLVYELPIGVQYDALQTQKSRLFVSAAASSYFMISQAYDYTFESPNPGADTGWRSQRSESYWFSVGMISAGYERYVHRSLAIGIEPYLKIPLSEIGWPNVKLFSAGAYVTLRYRFMNRKSIND